MSSKPKLEKQISFAPETTNIDILSENNGSQSSPKDSQSQKRANHKTEGSEITNQDRQQGSTLPPVPQPYVDNTNYDVWSRTQQPEQSSITTRRKPGEKTVIRRFIREKPNVLLDKFGAKYGRPETACSSACQHPWLPRTKMRADEIQAQKVQGELSLLRTQIKIAQKHLNEIRERRDQLLESNMKEQEQIMRDEENVHKDVYNLIVKYGKFRGAAESGQKLFELQKRELDREVAETKIYVQKQLEKEQKDVEIVDKQLADAKKQYEILLTYKEDAFFKNNAEIADLEQELIHSAEKHEKHVKDIEQLMVIEREKMKIGRKESEMKMVAETAQEFMEDVHYSWKQMAEENGTMRYNIEKLRLECRLLERETKQMKKEIKERMNKPTSNVRSVIFPQLFRATTVCRPDDDVILDIPTQKTKLLF